MSISPFSARPAPPTANGGGRSRLVVLIATLGIAATLLAYSVSPGVRHAVSHAAHSVRHAVSNVLDHDKNAKKSATSRTKKSTTTTRTRKAPTGGTAAP
jgi:hypothetical protein